MILTDEKQLLDPGVRKQIIEEIKGQENVRRKNEAFKRYKCYKDQTHLYVLEHLLAQFSGKTVERMQYALSNISIAKKIVNKLARVYSNGVSRSAGKDQKETDQKIDELTKKLKVNQSFKKLNRFLRLQKNTLMYVKPVKCDDGKYKVKLVPLQPYFYDAIEDPNDPERPMAVILSHYNPPNYNYTQYDPGIRSTHEAKRRANSDGRDQMIADRPEDGASELGLEAGKYIVWSKGLHFTMNEKGEIVSDTADMMNPILELPFEVFAEDQDNSFWAEGGDDVVDGAIRVNTQLTNLAHIGMTQGYGQLILRGPNIPKEFQVGPDNAMVFESAEGSDSEAADAKFINSGAPINELKDLAVMKIALLLSTNNLSTKHVAADLSSSSDFPSAIAMVVDMAESVEDVEDQEQVFMDGEPAVWRKMAKWMNVYKAQGLLDEELAQLLLPDDVVVTPEFQDATPIMSEKEELEVLQLRKDLGLDRMVDLMMRDKPGLTEEEALARLDQIINEKMERAAQAGIGEDGEPNGEGDGNDGDGLGDQRDDKPGPGAPEPEGTEED